MSQVLRLSTSLLGVALALVVKVYFLEELPLLKVGWNDLQIYTQVSGSPFWLRDRLKPANLYPAWLQVAVRDPRETRSLIPKLRGFEALRPL
jgi:hypothetical protein